MLSEPLLVNFKYTNVLSQVTTLQLQLFKFWITYAGCRKEMGSGLISAQPGSY